MCICICIYIYIYICVDQRRANQLTTPYCTLRSRTDIKIPLACCLRFVSDWTQPLDILNADSEFVCYYLSTKGCLGNPTLGTNLGQRILAMGTGCKPWHNTLQPTTVRCIATIWRWKLPHSLASRWASVTILLIVC